MFLDKPSAGVDPVAKRWMLKFMDDNPTGRTVLLTTNTMEEVETLGNMIGIIAPRKRVLNIFLNLYHVALSLFFS